MPVCVHVARRMSLLQLENINLEKLGKYYGQMYVRFDMEKYLGYLERFNLDRKQTRHQHERTLQPHVVGIQAVSFRLFVCREPFDKPADEFVLAVDFLPYSRYVHWDIPLPNQAAGIAAVG